VTAADAPAVPEFRVLLVCTGNICRSPIVEQVLRERLALPGVVFSSAGTAAIRGAMMPVEAAAVSIRLGGEPAGHRARPLEGWMVADADLILTMSREHRSAVVRQHATAHRRAFTLREFERLLAGMSDEVGRDLSIPDALRALVPRVAARRGVERAARPEDLDIPDPYQRGRRAYERAGRLIDGATASISSDLSRRLER